MKPPMCCSTGVCMPLVLVDGVVMSRGVYPDCKHLADFAGFAEEFSVESADEPLPSRRNANGRCAVGLSGTGRRRPPSRFGS